MSAESDVMAAVTTQWNAQFLNVFVPGGLHLDQLQRPDATLPILPYAVFTVAQDRRPRFTLGGTGLYKTLLTFDFYDTNVLGPVVSVVHGAFDWTPFNGTPLQNRLTMPANVSHEYTELGTEEEGVTPLERGGKKVRKATVRFIIWTRRFQG